MQAHLTVNPRFVDHLRRLTRAEKTLALLDESNLLMRPSVRVLTRVELTNFVESQRDLPESDRYDAAKAARWLELSSLLAQARTDDLWEGNWSFPAVDVAWALEVQRRGRALFGPAYRFLAYEVHHFAESDICSRERLPGEVHFAALPSPGRSFIVYTGSMARELARYRIDPDHTRPSILSPFQELRFEHPETRWYNLNTLEGPRSTFPATPTGSWISSRA
jgi:hypothetical protein